MRAWRLFLGMLAGNAVGGVLCLIVNLVMKQWPTSATLVGYPSLFLVPFVIGLVAARFWRTLDPRIGALALHSLSCTLLGLAAAGLILREGYFCLLIVSPLLYLGVFAGALTGRIWFRVDRGKLNLSVLPLCVLAVVGEPISRVDEMAVATDAIVIHAPPERVWPHVTSFPEIAAPPRCWLFRAGLPMPMATTSAGDFVGADRRCIFSGGAVFREVVAEIAPRERLTFDIVEPPQDPELIGHLTAHRGQFELRDNCDGTTTLVGRTWYSLHVRPLWYFDWWTRYIFRAVHLRVMENVREQSEGGG